MPIGPYLASAMVSAGAALFGQKSQNDANLQATREANAAALRNQQKAQAFNARQAQKSLKASRANYERSVQVNRANAKTDFDRSRQMMNKANEFNAGQAATARKWDEARREEVRGEALEDQASQFTRLRASAEAAGFNPLAALGAGQMTPVSGPLQSSSFAASASPMLAPIASGGMAETPSVPMSYGAPVAVAPIASNDAVIGAVAEVGRELTGAAAIERANEKFFGEVARIQAEAEGPAVGMSYPSVPSSAMPALGSAAVPAAPFSIDPGWQDGRAPSAFRIGTALDADRPVERVADDNISGTMQVENDFTGGPVNIMGSGGEPWGWDEMKVILPQIGFGMYQNFIGQPFARSVTRAVNSVGRALAVPADPYSPTTYSQPSLGPVDDIGRPLF